MALLEVVLMSNLHVCEVLLCVYSPYGTIVGIVICII